MKNMNTTFYVLLFCLIFSGTSYAQPDLVVSTSSISNTLRVDYINNNDPCFINEGCVGGTGARQLLRFTTRIDNIGDTDFYVGQPPANSSEQNAQWEWDECHNHWHYEGYARYVVSDADGNELPASFKNGFCLMDITCPNGVAKFNCSNQGISAGCADIYSSGLDCQWIDVTDLSPGNYKLSVEVNWDRTPDAYGNVEASFTNNIAQVCFALSRSGGQISVDIINCSNLNSGGGSTTCHDYEYTLRFKFDNYPEETTFRVQDANGNQVAIGGPYGQFPDGSTHQEPICLPQGCYQLTIEDSYGDGICCGYGSGNYELLDDQGNVVAAGGEFASAASHDFCVNDQPVEPPVEGPCPGNVLPDGSFETIGLTGWELEGRVKIVQNANTGSYAARLNRGVAKMSYTINVRPGDDISFCGYFKVRRSPAEAYIGIDWLDDNFQLISTETKDIASRNYAEYCISSTAPAAATFLRVFVYQNGRNSRLFVDDVCLDGTISGRSAESVNFLEMDVAKRDRSVKINWASRSRQPVKYYAIERSADNMRYERIMTYPVNTQNAAVLHYDMIDSKPLRGTNYYRVRQVLENNSYVVSRVRRVEFDFDLSEIALFPNPASDQLLVDMRVLAGKACQMVITDNLGVQRKAKHFASVPDAPYRLDLSQFSPGVYRLSLKVDDRRLLTKTFVVIKN